MKTPFSGFQLQIVLTSMLAALSLSVARGQYAIDWFSLDGGGGTSTGGAYILSGVIGQPDAGRSSGGSFTLEGGFLSAAISEPLPTPAPLRITLTSSNTVLVAWPAPSPGLDLRHSSELQPGAWLNVTNIPVVVGNENQVIISPPNGSSFYRLERK